MSETEHMVGKLIPVELTGTIEEQAKQAMNYIGSNELSKWYDTWLEQLESECKNLVYLDGVIYTVMNEDIDPDDDIMKANKNDDGSISYELKYYNGGCGFVEALECAIGRIDE